MHSLNIDNIHLILIINNRYIPFLGLKPPRECKGIVTGIYQKGFRR